ncbi:MAG TPA: NAD-dependent epimerase/dehydratase family protein [Candidatus Baltobacteraceae bacterium]|nr:NAD-dependent epimerase/dehydratase family protein [Candidatus Baltobacteraceae bacterium]
MNVLIIGGTRFVGRHIAQAFTERGHGVTLFNRGSNPGVHEDLDQVHGDRATDLPRLDGRAWDAVIDTSCYTPNVAEISARYFAGRAKRYVFISTISVYDHAHTQGPDENAPLLELPQEANPAEFDEERYGALKALCEQTVRRHFGERVTVLRPGLVAGPFDPTDRFTYWPVRFDEGGEVVTPLPQSRLQYIDARDLAQFVVSAVENGIDGTFNVVTQAGAVTFGDLCNACMSAAAPEDAIAVPLTDEFLGQHDVRPWSELPLWIPAASEYGSIASADSSRAAAAGLHVRPIADTVRDTLAWARGAEKRPGALKAGMAPEREAELLAAAAATGVLDSLR